MALPTPSCSAPRATDTPQARPRHPNAFISAQRPASPSNTCSPEDIHSPGDTHTPWEHLIPHGATHSLGQPHGGCNSPVGPGVPLSTPLLSAPPARRCGSWRAGCSLAWAARSPRRERGQRLLHLLAAAGVAVPQLAHVLLLLPLQDAQEVVQLRQREGIPLRACGPPSQQGRGSPHLSHVPWGVWVPAPSPSLYLHSPPQSRSPSGRSSAPSHWDRPAAAAAKAAPHRPASAGTLQRQPPVTGGHPHRDTATAGTPLPQGTLLLEGCCHHEDAATTGISSPWGTPLPQGTRSKPQGTLPRQISQLQECCPHGDTAAQGKLPLRGHHCKGGHYHCGGHHHPRDITTMGSPLPRGSCHHRDTATATETGPPQGTTLLILLGPLKEGELAGVVDDGELAEEGVDDLAGAGV